MYSNISCIVYFSPISASNNVKGEQELLVALLHAGFSVRLTQSEIERLSLSLGHVKASKDSFFNEFIYSTKDTLEMNGSQYANIRNKFKKFGKEGGTVESGYTSDVTDFILAWAKMKKLHYRKFIDFLVSHGDLVSCTRLYLRGVLQGFTAVEKVGDYYHAAVIVPNHESCFDILPAMHYHMVKNLSCGDTYITTGAGVVDGLDFQKRRLRPCKEEPVYRLQPVGDRLNAYSLVKSFL